MIKSKIEGEVVKKDLEFPKLMIYSKTKSIVLFTAPGTGTLVFTESLSSHVGYYSVGWDMSNFTDFNGTIKLSNADLS